MNENTSTQQTMINNDRLLKPNEIAALLNISQSFVYHLLQTGAIPAVRLGKVVRIRPADLVEFVEKNIHRQA